MIQEKRRVGVARLAISGLVLALLPIAAGAGAETPPAYEPAPPDLDGRELARRAEDSLRANRSYFKGRMTVESPRLTRPRVVVFESWDDRPEKKSFIRIHRPAKDEGTGFLKLHPNLWIYIPRVERTTRVPPSMMLQSWMGSDFTNDDLVRQSSEIDDYDHRVLGIDRTGAARPCYVVEYVPHEDAAVVWGRIVAWLEIEHGTPLRQDFYDEEGEHLRSIVFDELRDREGRLFPHRWTLTPLDKEGHRTVIEVEEITFDPEIDDDVFSKRNLRRGR